MVSYIWVYLNPRDFNVTFFEGRIKDHEDIQYLSKLEDKILNKRNRAKQTITSDYFK